MNGLDLMKGRRLGPETFLKFAGWRNHKLAQINSYLRLSTQRSGRHIANNVVWTPYQPCFYILSASFNYDDPTSKFYSEVFA